MKVKLGKDYFDTTPKLYIDPSLLSSEFGQMKGTSKEAKQQFYRCLLDKNV